MLDFSFSELLLCFVVALVVLGPERMPALARTVGRWTGKARVYMRNLTAELEELRRRKVPVVVLWGDQDTVVPRASFDALCAALGSEGEVVAGSHSWMVADPDAFGEIMTNVVAVAQLARDLEGDGKGAGPTGLGRRLAERLSRSGPRGSSVVPPP